MPTYEYACTTCDHTFEQVQSFSDASLTTCPECGGSLRKLYGAVGVVFKGSGFYRTDSRKAESSSAPSSPGKIDTSSIPSKKEATTTTGTPAAASTSPAASTKPSATSSSAS